MVYKAIPNFPGYNINKHGEVISFFNLNGSGIIEKSHVVKNYVSNKGYYRVRLRKNNRNKRFSIHRLLAQVFIPNHECKPQVNHINGIKTDNRLENLEWCTASENMKHAVRVLGHIRGSKNCKAKLTESDVITIRSMLKEGASAKELSLAYCITDVTIYDIKTRKTWTHI